MRVPSGKQVCVIVIPEFKSAILKLFISECVNKCIILSSFFQSSLQTELCVDFYTKVTLSTGNPIIFQPIFHVF